MCDYSGTFRWVLKSSPGDFIWREFNKPHVVLVPDMDIDSL